MKSQQKLKPKFPKYLWVKFIRLFPKVRIKSLRNLRILSSKIFTKTIVRIKKVFTYLKQSNTSCFVIIILFIFISVIFAGILPSNHIFEGNLLVKNLSFTYTGEENNKLFLNRIRGVSQIEAEGHQIFELNGNFSSPSNPNLNQKLIQQKSLKIILPHEMSQWRIEPATSQEGSGLEISYLRLQPNTNIESLSYNPYNRRLYLSMTPEQNVEVKRGQVSKIAQISLDIGQYPVKLTFKGYQVEQLGLQDSPESPNPIEIVFQSDSSQLNLPLIIRTRLSAYLPDPNKVNSEEWLWGDLAVKNLRFEQPKRTGVNLNDERYNSTIIKGQIRLGEREFNIESNQFLLVSKPGIQRLLNLEIIPPKESQEIKLQISGETVEISKPSAGLEVRFAGQANQIQVGLDSRFPVKTIKSTFLSKFLSNDVIIAVISFLAATTLSLLNWIINDFRSWLSASSKSTPSP